VSVLANPEKLLDQMRDDLDAGGLECARRSLGEGEAM
jgi:hypothetical protein